MAQHPHGAEDLILGDAVVRLELTLADKAEWVKVFDPRDSTLFVSHNSPPAVGSMLRVDLVVGKGGPKVILRGQVIARRLQGDATLPKGVSIALGQEEREKINYLNGFVRGGLLNLRERRRLPLRLPVTYGGVNGPVKSFSRDVNEEGIFILSNEPLPEDSEIHILLTVPSQSAPLSLTGIVAHTVVIEDEDIPGMGIRFRFSGTQSEAFRKIIDSLDKKFLSGQLPDELLL